MKKLKVLFLVTEDWYFWSHRLPLARALRERGAEVWVMTRIGDLGDAIAREGFKVISWRISRRNANPLAELPALLRVLRVYRDLRPDIVQHVALKPILHGGIAARLTKRIPSINVVAGLGHMFLGTGESRGALRWFLLALLRWIHTSASEVVVFQNGEDRDFFVGQGVVREEFSVIVRGAGVNTDQFAPSPEPDGVPVVVLPTRMLWEKGVGEFVAAAEMLQRRGILARFVLVGKPDEENHACIPRQQLVEWDRSGVVEWWGHRDDMPNVFSEASLVCYPSYREGVPKCLLEAASCGRAIVTTDAPGCREVVRHGKNGLIVPARDAHALAEAIATLLQDSALRRAMGIQGRGIATREFSEQVVINQMIGVYQNLLGDRWPALSWQLDQSS
jgi:glycosyltransferase involved in cell wall biosynthesis